VNRIPIARIILAIVFFGFVFSPIFIKRMAARREAEKSKLDVQTSLARHGFYLEEVSRAAGATYRNGRGAVLDFIDSEFGGVLPPTPIFYRTHNHFYHHLYKHGRFGAFEPYLYPNAYGLFPYYLAIILHTAGNSQAIAEMQMDCLQPIPLLDDREMLVWDKPRSSTVQRRSFRSSDSFEPPTLIREVIDWTQRLRSRVKIEHRNRLFLMKTTMGPTAATRSVWRGCWPPESCRSCGYRASRKRASVTSRAAGRPLAVI